MNLEPEKYKCEGCGDEVRRVWRNKGPVLCILCKAEKDKTPKKYKRKNPRKPPNIQDEVFNHQLNNNFIKFCKKHKIHYGRSVKECPLCAQRKEEVRQRASLRKYRK